MELKDTKVVIPWFKEYKDDYLYPLSFRQTFIIVRALEDYANTRYDGKVKDEIIEVIDRITHEGVVRGKTEFKDYKPARLYEKGEKIMEKYDLDEVLDELVSGVDHDCSMGYDYEKSLEYYSSDLTDNYGITIDEAKKIKKQLYSCFKKELKKEIKNGK